MLEGEVGGQRARARGRQRVVHEAVVQQARAQQPVVQQAVGPRQVLRDQLGLRLAPRGHEVERVVVGGAAAILLSVRSRRPMSLWTL